MTTHDPIEALRLTLATVLQAESTNTRSAGVDYDARCLLRDHGAALLALLTAPAATSVTEPVLQSGQFLVSVDGRVSRPVYYSAAQVNAQYPGAPIRTDAMTEALAVLEEMRRLHPSRTPERLVEFPILEHPLP